jgi:hypothetical protein
MKPVYDSISLANLQLVKEAKQWQKQEWISKEQLEKITTEYPSVFYHPNIFIRILLFIATLIALSGITGLLGLFVASAGRVAISIMCIIYGVASWIVVEKAFVKNNKHYKSGVNEALLYHSVGFIIGGLAGVSDFNIYVVLISCVVVFSFAAIRFIDLISTAAALCSLAGLIFYSFYQLGGMAQKIIPIVMIISFSVFYFLVRLGRKAENKTWDDCLVIAEAFSLLLVYAAGNYLVVRELSVSLLNMSLAEGEDIPLAWLFYFLTAAVPVAYLYFGIKRKDIVMIRVSLVAIAFAVFTFKYYFSLGHHEISLTVAGIILIGIAAWLFRFLKTPKNGYTAENVMTESWGSANLSGYLISQTLGGNKTPERPVESGGTFGGGGSSDSF